MPSVPVDVWACVGAMDTRTIQALIFDLLAISHGGSQRDALTAAAAAAALKAQAEHIRRLEQQLGVSQEAVARMARKVNPNIRRR